MSSNTGPSKTPWMTIELRESERKLRELQKLWIKHPNRMEPGNTMNNSDTFKNYRNTHSKLRRSTKRSFFNKAFGEVKHDAKKTWNLINTFTKTKKVNSNITELKEEGRIITDSMDIANSFNSFYSNVGALQASTIPESNINPKDFLNENHPDSMFLHPVTKEEIEKAGQKLAKKQSKGPDEIPTFMILKNLDILSAPLEDCINTSFSEGTFPDSLKHANVIPLYKKKERSNPTNYRPVSLLNALSKVIEKIIYFRVYKFMGDKLYGNQFGFRENHSTVDLMIMTIENICRQLDEDGYSIPLYFDLGKAFDTLPHSNLLHKLEYYGIRGIALDLIRSYLSNRTQMVTVNGKSSGKASIDIGVPQGSILGPLLFIIYINDIQKAAPEAIIGCYADDTTAIIPGKSPQSNIDAARETLNKLGEWFAANKLSLSPTKCKFALMSRNLKTPSWSTELEIYGKKLTEIKKDSESSSNPLVGLLMTENLSYVEHTKMLAGKLRSGMYALKANRHLPNIARKNIYFACIHSHLSYAGIIMGTAPKSCIKQLQVIQNAAIRILAEEKYNAPTGTLFRKLNIMRTEDIFRTQACTYGWKFINMKLPPAIQAMMNKGQERARQIQPRQFRNSNIKHLSPIDYITREWNALPLILKRAPSINVLKKDLCKHFIGKY